MAEVLERLLEDSTASSSSSENEEEIADTDGSLKTILDANTRPATACRTEEMDWSDNLSGIDNLIAASPSKTDGYSKEKGLSPMDELTESDTKKSVLTDICTNGQVTGHTVSGARHARGIRDCTCHANFSRADRCCRI